MAGEVGVGEVGFGGGIEAEGDGGDDVAVAVGGVEDASAVGEAALVAGEIDEGGGFEVEGADGGDGVGDLLTVGSYVLDGGAADGAGDAGEALDAGDSLLGDVEDEGVPVAAGGDGVVDVALPSGWAWKGCAMAMWRTRPSKPESLTRRLLPPPRTKMGRLLVRA